MEIEVVWPRCGTSMALIDEATRRVPRTLSLPSLGALRTAPRQLLAPPYSLQAVIHITLSPQAKYL
jgi:hypothetical protein